MGDVGGDLGVLVYRHGRVLTEKGDDGPLPSLLGTDEAGLKSQLRLSKKGGGDGEGGAIDLDMGDRSHDSAHLGGNTLSQIITGALGGIVRRQRGSQLFSRRLGAAMNTPHTSLKL